MQKKWSEILPLSTKKKLKEVDWSKSHPAYEMVLRPFRYFEPKDLKVVILGIDPYPKKKDACGLCFSVEHGKIPVSLQRIFKEYSRDLGVPVPKTGDLENWAREGVLLLNVSLTRGEKQHKKLWKPWFETLMNNLYRLDQPFVIIAWGREAQLALPNAPEHVYVITGGHPSPLNRTLTFENKNYFSKANKWLEQNGRGRVNWHLH